MKSHKLNRTDDQIEADVLARRDDLTAWEALPLVPPSRSPRPGLDGSLTLEREQPPSLDRGFGMLQRLARRRTASITEMRAAVRQRAKKKHR
jgi:hypothetical protein